MSELARMTARLICLLLAQAASAHASAAQLPAPAATAQLASALVCDQATTGAEPLLKNTGDWLLRSLPNRPSFDLEYGHPLDSNERRALGVLARALQARGIHTTVVPLPQRGVIAYLGQPATPRPAFYDVQKALGLYRRYVRELNQLGFEAIDLTQLTPQQLSHFGLLRDHHWRTEGAADTAALVAAQLRKDGLSGNVKAFPLKTVGKREIAGTLAKLVNQNCGAQLPPETVQQYAVQAQEAGDLLGDEETFVVFGTSNTATPEFSFVDLLRASTGLNFINQGLVGGGSFGALESWFAAKDNPMPKVAVWEQEYLIASDKQTPETAIGMKAWQLAAQLAGTCTDQPLPTRAASQGTDVPTPLPYGTALKIVSSSPALRSLNYRLDNGLSGILAKSLRETNNNQTFYLTGDLTRDVPQLVHLDQPPATVQVYACTFPQAIVNFPDPVVDTRLNLVDYALRKDYATAGFTEVEEKNVRWGLAPASRVFFSGQKDSAYTLSMSFYSPLKVLSLEVWINGKKVDTVQRRTGESGDLRYPFTATGHDEIKLTYSSDNTVEKFIPGSAAPLSVLFRTLEVQQNR